jgi:hypothetical protein
MPNIISTVLVLTSLFSSFIIVFVQYLEPFAIISSIIRTSKSTYKASSNIVPPLRYIVFSIIIILTIISIKIVFLLTNLLQDYGIKDCASATYWRSSIGATFVYY